MADAVRLGTASAILHRYLKTARARPRFRSRGPAIRFSTSPHCESAAAVSARPHFSGTAPASTRSDSDSANSTLHGDEGSGIDWHQRRYCRNLEPEKRCTTSTYVRNEVESKKQLVHPHRTRSTFPSAASCAAAGHTSRRLSVTAAGAHDSAYRTPATCAGRQASERGKPCSGRKPYFRMSVLAVSAGKANLRGMQGRNVTFCGDTVSL
jgi:hypothetical protein